MFLNHNEEPNFSINRFESMLKTNDILFFDSIEFENIIHHYLDLGKLSLAKKAIRLGLDQHPQSIQLLLFKVEVSIMENKLGDANQILNKLEQIEPSNEEIYIQKANIYSKRDDHKTAIQLLKKALKLSKDSSDIHALLAMEYMFEEDFDNAKLHYMACLKDDPEDYASLHNVIYCFDVLGENKQAIEFLLNYLDKNPYCEVAWHQLGKAYKKEDNLEKALQAFDYALLADEYFMGAYFEKGKVLEKMNRIQEAIKNYQITLELEDPSAYAYLRIGKCYEKLEILDVALHYLQKATTEDPLLDKAWLAITDFFFRQKNYRKALYFIDKAIEIDQENVRYWKLYAKINQKLNFLEEAEKGYKQSIELGNYELETWVSHADVLIEIGETASALSVIKKAAEFYPETEEVIYRLAALYFVNNKGTLGYKYLVKALEVNKEYLPVVYPLFKTIFDRPSIQEIIKSYQ
ncbi:tetratricopeptide repeat protein [Mesonia sediminis]|uniref:Tetratricopeptide repeat protein n=1 Tax=Mesonia sediminis TaxID=1703946 RepID=A0ABW5SCB9_9FLAO